MTTSTVQPIPPNIGSLLRDWRLRRRLSQLDLALDAEVSTRHISFLETGRAIPSRAMLIRLADRLSIPLRDRNTMLVSAGYAPMYPERTLTDPEMTAARSAIDRVLAGHEPYPAIAVDRTWTMLSANRAVSALLGGIAPNLLEPPVNVLRVALHPDGLAPSVVNFDQWREHIFYRLARQLDHSGDPAISALLAELKELPDPERLGPSRSSEHDSSGVLVPLRLRTDLGELTFISTVTIFGSPLDVTLSEIAIEAFFPADPQTAARLQQIGSDTANSYAPYSIGK